MSTMPKTSERKRLSVQGLTHSYGGNNAISDIAFTIEPGEIVALLGPSGCGKSTVLRAIAGLIQPKAGKIELGNQNLAAVSARARGIGMVFQNYALFPHLTVAENIAYPLACQQVPRAERKARVAEMLELVRLGEYANRLPRELSGGQQQRALRLPVPLPGVHPCCYWMSLSVRLTARCASIFRLSCCICKRAWASPR